MLVNYLVSKVSRRMGKHITSIPRHVMAKLENASWAGNVRELQNFVERAVILTPGNELQVSSDELLPDSVERVGTMQVSLQQAERAVIFEALKEACGRVSGKGGAAERLGLKRTTLQNRMRKLCIGPPYDAAPADWACSQKQ